MNRNQVLERIGNWRRLGPKRIVWSEVSDMIRFLEENTGKDLDDDPFKNPNNTLFRDFSLTLRAIEQHQMAISSFKRYYGRILELELEHKERIHKGDCLHWIGRYCYELKRFEEAFYYWILTYLDDILSEFYHTTIEGNICIGESLRAPVAEMLQLFFGIPIVNLQKLKENSMKILNDETETILHPEVLMLKLRSNGHQIPRLVDYQWYHPNFPHLRLMYETARKTKDFRLWEQFAAFLLSSIEGFEPMTNLRPGDGTYEFDVIIRNCSRGNLFVSRFGDYIGVECKYFEDKKVDVGELNHFASKLKYHDIQCGIIFSKTPITGWENAKGEQFGKLVQTKIFNRTNIVIFDINENDIERILSGINLVELIVEKYETVRLGL